MDYEEQKAAQQARANRLRDQIQRLKSGSQPRPSVVKSPRDFVEEKLRQDLAKPDRKKKKH